MATPAVGHATALSAAAKRYTSAVCLVPPRSTWAPLQEARCFADMSFVRWPPHVNLLYPFLEARHFPEAAQAAAAALASLSPFQVTLSELCHFEHGRSCTLWVRPDPTEELAAVQAALEAAFPQCSDLSSDAGRGINAFTPHLSLGQHRSRAEVLAVAAQLAATWQPVSFQADGVALIARDGYDAPFTVRWFVPFGRGGGQPVTPVEVGAPYLATVGDAAPGSSAAVQRWGLGATRPDGTVWQFAYGANMALRKLSGVRGLTPLESLPASLPGWRLAFTHRGGMGNLERLAPGGAAAPESGLPAVHGVLHRLTPAAYAQLANMEHEYRPLELLVQPYGAAEPVAAVAFVTPEARRIADGLPPPQRYLDLLQEGARHWRLDAAYTQWLCGLQGIDPKARDVGYYTAASGEPLEALPKIRTGSQPQRRGQQQQRRRGPPRQRGAPS